MDMDYFHCWPATNNAIVSHGLNISESPLSSGSKPQNKIAGNIVILVEYFYELQNFSTENIPFYMTNSKTQGSNSMYFQEFSYSIIQNDVTLKQNYFP